MAKPAVSRRESDQPQKIRKRRTPLGEARHKPGPKKRRPSTVDSDSLSLTESQSLPTESDVPARNTRPRRSSSRTDHRVSGRESGNVPAGRTAGREASSRHAQKEARDLSSEEDYSDEQSSDATSATEIDAVAPQPKQQSQPRAAPSRKRMPPLTGVPHPSPDSFASAYEPHEYEDLLEAYRRLYSARVTAPEEALAGIKAEIDNSRTVYTGYIETTDRLFADMQGRLRDSESKLEAALRQSGDAARQAPKSGARGAGLPDAEANRLVTHDNRRVSGGVAHAGSASGNAPGGSEKGAKDLDASLRADAALAEQRLEKKYSEIIDTLRAKLKTSAAELDGLRQRVQKLQQDSAEFGTIKTRFKKLCVLFTVLEKLTGVQICQSDDGSEREGFAKMIRGYLDSVLETSRVAVTLAGSYVFAIGDFRNQDDYLGRLIVEPSSDVEIQCLRAPRNVSEANRASFTDGMDAISMDGVYFIFQQMVKSLIECSLDHLAAD